MARIGGRQCYTHKLNFVKKRLRIATATSNIDGFRVLEPLSLAISALEKQLPKRPHADDNGGCEYYECWIECPDCGEAILEYTSENETYYYCVGCGQKLDWSEVHEI